MRHEQTTGSYAVLALALAIIAGMAGVGIAHPRPQRAATHHGWAPWEQRP